MSSKSSMSGIVCINHPNTQAISRCFVCRKPLCPQCSKQQCGMTFCSEQCMASGLKSIGDVNQIMKNKSRSERRSILPRLIFIIIIALVGLMAFHFRKPLLEQWNKWSGKSVNTIQELKEDSSKKFNNKIDRVQKKQHGNKYDAVDRD